MIESVAHLLVVRHRLLDELGEPEDEVAVLLLGAGHSRLDERVKLGRRHCTDLRALGVLHALKQDVESHLAHVQPLEILKNYKNWSKRLTNLFKKEVPYEPSSFLQS